MSQTKDFDVSDSSFLPFDPIVLVRDVLKKWTLILLAAVVVGVGAYIYAEKSYVPFYETSTTLVVNNRSSSTSVYNNLQSTTELAGVFTSLLNSSVLQKLVMEEVNMDVADYQVYASAIAETNLLTIRVTSGDPRTAFLVLRALVENHHVVTDEVVGDVVIEVLQLPQVPTAPANKSNIVRQVEKTMLLAAAVTCIMLTVSSYFRDTVRSRKEAETKLRCWCLGELPHEKKYKTFSERISRRFSTMAITNPSNSFRFVEANRKFRRRVEQNMGEDKVLMVTSVMENEGKSTVSVNLALTLSMKHHKVLLIDLDLRKPACHKILQMKGGAYGTRDVIGGRVELTQAIEKDALSGLNVMLERTTVKSAKPQVASMIASEGLGTMIQAAKEMYDYVILDLSPLSAAPDAEYVMEYADATLLVVHQNATRANMLNKAINILQSGRARLLGCVLNNVYSSGFMSNNDDADDYDISSVHNARTRKTGTNASSRTGK